MTAIFIVNLPEFKSGLDITKANLEKAAEGALLQASTLIENQAKRNANTGTHKKGEPRVNGGVGPNVVTGNLRNNIRTQPIKKGFGAYIATVTSEAEYARAVEEGSSRWKSGVSYPYLNPAFETLINNGQLTRVFNGALRAALRG